MTRTREPAARLAAMLFVISGALVLANNYAPASGHLNKQLLAWIGLCAIASGLLVAYVVPWHRLPRRTTLVLPSLGLGFIAVANSAGGVSAQSYSAFFILVAAYIGTTQRRWTTLAFAAPMIAVYMVGLASRPDATATAVWSVTIVVPVAVLVGEVIASALARLESMRLASARRAELLAVTAAAARTVSSLEPRRILGAVADASVRLGYDAVTVEVFERGGDTYRCAEARGLPPTFVGARHPSHLGITGQVRSRRAQVVVEGYDQDPQTPDTLRGLGFEVVIGTPIWTRAELAAVLNVGMKRDLVVESGELEALELLAEQAGQALQVAQEYARQGRDRRRYRRESLVDQLSGLGNRRRAEQLLDGARAGDAVAMLDLDDFKRLNDTLGHDAGDEVIRRLGAMLRAALRAGDAASRFGGEESLILIRRPGEELHDVLDRLFRRWAATGPATTFSVGTAVIARGEAARGALSRADAALRRAKRDGKNVVRHADVVLPADQPIA